MFVREVLDATYGAATFSAYRADSAKHAAAAWKAAGLALAPDVLDHYPQPGDILYKTSGTFGHVGIYCGRLHLADGDENGYVAENSSTKIGRVSGAKGYRSLEDFGRVDLVVRLSPPQRNEVPPKEKRTV
jgi:hypothetical protein